MKITCILIPHGEMNKISSLLNVSRQWVRKSLNGDSSTELAMLIRRTAIERGGVEVKNKRNKHNNTTYENTGR